ncbi:MAG: TIGR00730 family Rossman fold protein [Planctomycetota bacterium]|nr:TIGR00730 family Rossman fold protein [Planctomycetota bacterium]
MKFKPNPDAKLLCVFCGSQSGARKLYSIAANAVGDEIARQGMGLVYGGGKVGLMGIVADAVLAGGGQVVGVIPDVLMTKELAHDQITKLEVVNSMHQRKARMAELACGFLTLPGGIGTFEEFFEIVTWAVLGIHQKPIGLLNVDGYFDPILRLLGHAVEEKFLRPQHLDLILVGEDPAALVTRLASHKPPSIGPLWLDLNQS